MGQENAPALGCVNEAVGDDRRRPLALDRGIRKSDAASEGPPSYFSNRGPRAQPGGYAAVRNQKPRQEGRGLAV